VRTIILFLLAFLLASPFTSAQAAPPKDMKKLFEAVQRVGVENALRGDISSRLGFGEDHLIIHDLVITKDGLQHALNAFVYANKSYILFHTRRYAPEIYIFVEEMKGEFVAGFHGRQFQSIAETVDMTQKDVDMVVGPEEAFWFQWLADGAKGPPPPEENPRPYAQ